MSFKISQSTNIGYFIDTRNVFAQLLLLDMVHDDREFSLLCAVSLIHVKNRIVFVYVYRLLSTGQDAPKVVSLTKDWTSQIVAANQ